MDEKRVAFSQQSNTPSLQYFIIFGYDYVNS